jgi:4-alpha-glucanotransferase
MTHIRRGSGVLLHLSSLPSVYGIGDLGPSAYRFIDFLHSAKQKYWQILPLNPTDQGSCNSPYSCLSAFAGNPLLISPEKLAEDGWIEERELRPIVPESVNVDYHKATTAKQSVLESACRKFVQEGLKREEYEQFCRDHAAWLEDFALFMVFKNHYNLEIWHRWMREVRVRDPKVLEAARQDFPAQMERVKFWQFLFFRQWRDLRKYANENGIAMIGDIPIYVNYDSAEVWARPELFKLDEKLMPAFVGGVPPDYFSKTGQRWGNPVYNWDRLREQGYEWWIERLEHNLMMYDYVRIDHFRGFAAYWEIPAQEKTAVLGQWAQGPGEDFFNTLMRRVPDLPILAEDVGYITQDVISLIQKYDFPGMKLLQFAFGDDMHHNPYLPHNYSENCIVYAGTHDNNTIKGWFQDDARGEEKENLQRYLGHAVTGETVHHEMMALAMRSRASMVILTMQDLLGLGKEARMNKPGTIHHNWEWRFGWDEIKPQMQEYLKRLTDETGR